MNIDRIITRFKKNGYTVVRCQNKIVVKKQYGFAKQFDSYHAAYNYYF